MLKMLRSVYKWIGSISEHFATFWLPGIDPVHLICDVNVK